MMQKAGFGYAVCRRREIMRCIAAGQELWFERPGFSPVPPHRPSCHARGKCRAQRDRAGHHASGGRQKKGPEQAVFLVEGAHWTMLVLKRLVAFIIMGVTALSASAALAATAGQPEPWQLGMQKGATPVMDDIIWFHDLLLWLITAIALFVLVLLVIVVVRFNARANPTPSRTTHNTLLEVMWTLVPVIILVAIAVPSFKLLFLQTTIPPADLTVKATGKQWYWSYSYPDSKFEFDSLMLQDNERKPDQPRLLAVDNELVVPVNKVIRVQVIGSDVIHAFAVPSFGIKIDAVPGRLNETWFKATRE